MNVPNKIKEIIKDYPLKKDELGRSDKLIYFAKDKYVLKISKSKKELAKEKDILLFLEGKLPVAKCLHYEEDEEYAYLLETFIDGVPLCSEEYLKNPLKLINLLKQALDIFHKVDVSNCGFMNEYSKGSTFVHGDFCLPNILVKDDRIVGFIDLNSSGLGDSYIDYSWCIWSFEYNLKTTKYTQLLLKELGIEFNKELFDKYVLED